MLVLYSKTFIFAVCIIIFENVPAMTDDNFDPILSAVFCFTGFSSFIAISKKMKIIAKIRTTVYVLLNIWYRLTHFKKKVVFLHLIWIYEQPNEI